MRLNKLLKKYRKLCIKATNMRLNKLLKEYRKLCIKARKVHGEILNIYDISDLNDDIKTKKLIMNTLYGCESWRLLSDMYYDTDSIADGMKYTE